MNAHQVLVAARALISKDAKASVGRRKRPLQLGLPLNGRVTGSIFATSKGLDTLKRSNATCFCSIGAIIGAIGCDADTTTGRLAPAYSEGATLKISFLPADEANPNLVTATTSQRRVFGTAYEYLKTACKRLFGGEIMELNDTAGSHERVLRAYDLAIKNAKRRHINGGKVSK